MRRKQRFTTMFAVALGALATACSSGKEPSTQPKQPNIRVNTSALLNDPCNIVEYDIKILQWDGTSYTLPGPTVVGVAPNGDPSTFQYISTPLFCTPQPLVGQDSLVQVTIHVYDTCYDANQDGTFKDEIYTATNSIFTDCPETVFNPLTGLNEIQDKVVATNFSVLDSKEGPGAFDVVVTGRDLYHYCKEDEIINPANSNERLAVMIGTGARSLPGNNVTNFLGVVGLDPTTQSYRYVNTFGDANVDGDLLQWLNPPAGTSISAYGYTLYETHALFPAAGTPQRFYGVENGLIARPKSDLQIPKCNPVRALAIFGNYKDTADGFPRIRHQYVGSVVLEKSTVSGTNDKLNFNYIQRSSDSSDSTSDLWIAPGINNTTDFANVSMDQGDANKLDQRATLAKEIFYDVGSEGNTGVGAFFNKGAFIYPVLQGSDGIFRFATCEAGDRGFVGCLEGADGKLLLNAFN